MSSITCYEHLNHDGSSSVALAQDRVVCGASNNAADVFNCCSAGDTCLENNICHFTHSEEGSTGYYIAGCTDPNYNDPRCSQYCTDSYLPDITYNYTSNQWACCSTDQYGPRCDEPTTETWQSPPPEKLHVLDAVPASATESGYRPTTAPNSTYIPLAASASASNEPHAVEGSLSHGAMAAVITVVVIVVLALLGVLAFFLLRRRRRQNADRSASLPPSEPLMSPYTAQYSRGITTEPGIYVSEDTSGHDILAPEISEAASNEVKPVISEIASNDIKSPNLPVELSSYPESAVETAHEKE